MNKNARKTHCDAGHPLSGDNLSIVRGWRVCRTCKRRQNARGNALTRARAAEGFCSRCGREPATNGLRTCERCRAKRRSGYWTDLERSREVNRRKDRLRQQRYPEKLKAIWRSEKGKARERLRYAVRSGAIQKPERCQRCGEAANLQGHHADYSKPLEVEWLCSRCHGVTFRKAG